MSDKPSIKEIPTHKMKRVSISKIGPIKAGLRSQYLPDNDIITTAVKKWVAPTGAYFYEHKTAGFCSGDFVEKMFSCSKFAV